MANYKKIFSYVAFSMFFISSGSVLALQKETPLSAPAKRLQEHVKYLASDKLGGRFPGSVGDSLARKYMIDFFTKNGILPAGLDGGYQQQFTVVTGVRPGERNALRFHGDLSNGKGVKVPFQYEAALLQDYTPLGFSADTSLSVQVVFAGYGISAAEIGYDDYEGLDVKGKAVVVFRGTPEPNNPHSAYERFAPLRMKALNAREQGAAAIIFVNNKSTDTNDSSDELMELRYDRGGKAGIVAMHIRRELLQKMLPVGVTLSAVEDSIQASKKPIPVAMPQLIAVMTAEVLPIVERTANVIGLIPGTEPALTNEYLVVGAHFDHLGEGGEGSLYSGKEKKTHYGADDNASGTAALLEIATRLKQKPLKRPVLLMGFGAEEMGLLGSARYVERPTVPLDSIVFMLNLDMVGRMKGDELQVGGTGTSSRWDDLLDSLKIVHKLSITKSKDGMGPSDHASFYGKGIPVLFLFTGLHSDYHRPTDTWEKINYEGQARIATFGADILQYVGNGSTKPDFVKVQTSMMQGQTRGFSVWVGTIPDYADHPDGMRITGTSEGSPAQEAGLLEGDVIIKFGESDVKNIYDYTYSLGNYKPGDEVPVVLYRNGDKNNKMTVTLKLRARNR